MQLRRRRTIERRRAGRRWIKLPLIENVCFAGQHCKLREAFCVFHRQEGERTVIETPPH